MSQGTFSIISLLKNTLLDWRRQQMQTAKDCVQNYERYRAYAANCNDRSAQEEDFIYQQHLLERCFDTNETL